MKSKKLKIVNDVKPCSKTGSRCVKCGEKASEGSGQHPYCSKCFTAIWYNDYNKYAKWLDTKHRLED